MLPTKYLAVVLAQAEGGSTTATIPLLLLCVVAGWFCVRYKGAQSPHVIVGVCIGVLGANTFIGTLVHSLLDVLIKIGTQVGNSFS
jgi:hypothetical protein